MEKQHIYYKSGYKYQLARTYIVDLRNYADIKPVRDVEIDFIRLNTAGILTIYKGYAWDGPSGPTLDTKNSLRGSLVHDALYQLIRLGKLQLAAKEAADSIFCKICIEDGMWPLRAFFWKSMVHLFGGVSCRAEEEHPELKAP